MGRSASGAATRPPPEAGPHPPPADEGGWLRRRPAAAAALVYGVLSILLFAPALLPGHTLSASDYLWTAAPWSPERPPDVRVFGSNYELVDSVTQFQPWLEQSRVRLPEAPLWNPHAGGGRPFLANAQSALLSPFSLPAYVLGFWWSLGLIAALKVFVAAFGTYLLARALGLRFGGALLAGLVYAFSLYFLVWISWPQTSVWALLPWLLLLADRVAREARPLPAAGLAIVVALQFFGGHPESNFHLLATTVAVLRLSGRPAAPGRGAAGARPPAARLLCRARARHRARRRHARPVHRASLPVERHRGAQGLLGPHPSAGVPAGLPPVRLLGPRHANAIWEPSPRAARSTSAPFRFCSPRWPCFTAPPSKASRWPASAR